MAGRFKDQVVVVTGGASGIGAAAARRFAAEGGKVVIGDLNVRAGEALASELEAAEFLCVDVTEENEVRALVERAVSRFGRLDCMINNAGLVGSVGPIAEISTDSWRKTIAILLDGVMYGTKYAAAAMMSQRSGAILNVASIAGLAGGLGPHAYTVAKHAVVGLTKSAGSELAAYGIRVNAVAPGATVTPLISSDRHGGPEKVLAFVAETSPLKRAITAEDIANALFFLGSEDGRNISGQTIAIDGGRVAFGIGDMPFHHEPAGYVAASGAGKN